MSWFNNDGLLVKFGTEKTVANRGGEYRRNGKLREVELTINLASLTQGEVIQSDQVFFPAGARIVRTTVQTNIAAATGTAIDVGLVRMDRTTEIDFDGILAAFVTASMNTVGELSILQKDVTIPTGLAGTGALHSIPTTFVGYITASMTDATSFTAGQIVITIQYYMP